MSEKLKELKQEATELGIVFSANIGEAKLQEKIDAFYESKETQSDELIKLVDSIKEDVEEKAPTIKAAGFRAIAKQMEAEAKKTKIIKVMDNDPYESREATTFTVTCENEYFDLGTKVYPLNEWIEVRAGHIKTLSEVKIQQHIRDPNNPALNQSVLRPRYTIIYKE